MSEVIIIKKYKKMNIAVALSVILILLTICIEAVNGDPSAELTMLIWGETQPDIASVIGEVNKITQKKIGAKVNIEYIPGAYWNKIKMKTDAKDDTYDVLWVGYKKNALEMIADGTLEPLTELINTYTPGLWGNIEDYMWEGVNFNGEHYAVPNTQVTFYQYGFMMQKELADEYGWDKDRIDSPNELESFLEKVKRDHPELHPYRGNYNHGMWYANKYEDVIDYIKIDTDSDGREAVDIFQTPEYKDGIMTFKDWYKKGYIREDRFVIDNDVVDCDNNKYAIYDTRWKPGAEAQVKQKNGKEYVFINIGKKYKINRDAIDTALGINTMSKNKEKAIRLIELLNTDKELYNLVAFGIKDRHYRLNDKGKVVYIENSGYAPKAAWKFGNQFNALLLEDEADDVWEETKRLNEQAEESPIHGFYFDPSPVAMEITKCTAIRTQYEEKYICTDDFADFDAMMEKFREALDKAGYNKIMSEVQRQLDEFFDNK